MSRLLVVRPEAEADIEEAYRWYEGRSPGLGADFLRAVEAVLSAVRREPDLYPRGHRQARRALLRRFPYGIVFVADEATIEVVACFHERRHPRHWRSRL